MKLLTAMPYDAMGRFAITEMRDGIPVAVGYAMIGDLARLFAAAPDLLAACEAAQRKAMQSLLDGYGCPFCKDGTGHYVDGEYWHSETCPLEGIEASIAEARGRKA